MKDLAELKKQLKENGLMGCDMSPGNDTEMEAYNVICDMEQEIERLRKLVSFYQGEGISHIIEMEYRELAEISPEQRTQKQIDRLVTLAQILSKAADKQNECFKQELDKAK